MSKPIPITTGLQKATLIANAVSLTPGTLTLEVRREPPTLYVHVLHLDRSRGWAEPG